LAFNVATRGRFQVASSCGCSHVFVFLVESGEKVCLSKFAGERRREDQSYLWKSRIFANRSFWCLFAISCSFKVVCVDGDVILCKI
jgi:hypothetical protein